MIINSITRSILKSIRRGIIGTGDSLRRTLIQLFSEANSRYELAKPVTFAGDFEIEVDIYIADVSAIATAAFILGNSAGANNGLWVSNVGRLLLRDDNGNTLTTDTAPITSGKLHHIKCSKVGGNVTIFVDDVEAEPAAAFGTIIFDRIGIRETVSFPFDGIISNVVLRDLDTPSNTQTFKLNQLNSDIEYPVENVFGGELWLNPPQDIQAGWVDNGDNTYTHTGANSELQVDTGDPLTPSTAYVFSVTVSGTGNVGLQLGGAPEGDDNNRISGLTEGTHTIALRTNSSIVFNAIRVISSTDVTVSNISVKKVTNAVKYIQIAQDLETRDTYTLVDGYWTGSNILSNGNFNNGATDWVIQSDWALVDGKVERATGSLTNRDITQSDVVTAGNTYEYSVDIVDYTSGNIDFWVGSSVPAGGSLGTHTTIVTPSISNFICFSDSAVGFIGSVDNISAKRLIEPVITLPQVLIDLHSEANSHYELEAPVTFSGDFEIEAEFATSDTTTSKVIVGADGSPRPVLYVTAGGAVTYKNAQEVTTASAAGFNDGKLHSVKVSRVGTTQTLFVDGVVANTGTVVSDEVSLDSIGQYNSGLLPFEGIISNVKLTDLATPSNSQTYKLSQVNTNLEYPVENVFGGELVTNGGFDTDSDWISFSPSTGSAGIASGVANCTGANFNDRGELLQVFNTVVGGVYTATVDCIQDNGAHLVAQTNAGNARAVLRTEAGGKHTLFFTATTAQSRIILRSQNGTSIFDNISVKQITNALHYRQIAKGLPDRDLYTLVDGYWTGSDIVTQDIWENPVTQGAQWAYDAGSNTWALVGDGNLSALQLIFTSLQPDVLQVAGSISGLTGDGLRLANNGTSVVIRQDGSYSEILDKTTDDGQVFKRSTGVVNATITKPTIKRLIGAT